MAVFIGGTFSALFHVKDLDVERIGRSAVTLPPSSDSYFAPPPLAGGRETEVAVLQRRPQLLDRIVERQIGRCAHQHPLPQRLALGQPNEDVVENADGVDYSPSCIFRPLPRGTMRPVRDAF